MTHLPGYTIGSHGEKTKLRVITRQAQVAIEAFHREYDKYPLDFKELGGANKHKKVFLDGAVELQDKYKLIHAVDSDNDGFVETDAGMIERKVAVWTYLDGKTIIKSWE